MIKRNQGLVRRAGLKRRPVAAGKQTASMLSYYHSALERSSWVCENCGEYICHATEREQFTAQAHILSKKDFPSVALHPDNWLHLCVRCHNQWDSCWSNAMVMKVYWIALQRFSKFMNLLNRTEIIQLPESFYAILILSKGQEGERIFCRSG